MSYIGNGQAHAALYAGERDLLLAGLSYSEIAQKTGERTRTISERNRLIHKIDIYDAFAGRVEREGIPSRMPSDMLRLAWFTGIVDGEGSFIVFTRACTARPQYDEFRLGLRVMVRADDAAMIETIQDLTGVGRISRHPARGNGGPTIAWCCEKVSDLAEVLVPIFDTIPLHSKKRHEYAIWRPLVARRYIDTMGGRSNRKGVAEKYRAAFQDGIQAIGNIRTFPARVT